MRDDENRSDEFLTFHHPDVGEIFRVRRQRRGPFPRHVRRLAARKALVQRLVADERWGLFEAWGHETGLVPAALEARQLLSTRPVDHAAAEAAGKRLGGQIEEGADQVAGLACRFIRETLRWPPRPWLVEDLATRFMGFIAASAMGPLDVAYGIEARRLVPCVYVAEFRTRPGEDVAAALKRIDAHIRDVKRARQAIASAAEAGPGRKAPRMPDTERIKRDVDWLYRRHTGLATSSDLAREHFSRGPRQVWSGDDSSIVRNAIKRAARDLGIPAPGK